MRTRLAGALCAALVSAMAADIAEAGDIAPLTVGRDSSGNVVRVDPSARGLMVEGNAIGFTGIETRRVAPDAHPGARVLVNPVAPVGIPVPGERRRVYRRMESRYALPPGHAPEPAWAPARR